MKIRTMHKECIPFMYSYNANSMAISCFNKGHIIFKTVR